MTKNENYKFTVLSLINIVIFSNFNIIINITVIHFYMCTKKF